MHREVTLVDGAVAQESVTTLPRNSITYGLRLPRAARGPTNVPKAKHATTAIASIPAAAAAPAALACSARSAKAAAAARTVMAASRLVGVSSGRWACKSRRRSSNGDRVAASRAPGSRCVRCRARSVAANATQTTTGPAISARAGGLTRKCGARGEHRDSRADERREIAATEQAQFGGRDRVVTLSEALKARECDRRARELRGDEATADRPRSGGPGPRLPDQGERGGCGHRTRR